MAVQAQYPSIAFRDAAAYVNNNVLQNFHQDHLQYGHHHQVFKINGTVFSDPESELTCNFVSASSRKRKTSTGTSTSTSTRGGDDQMHHHQQLNPQHHQHQENNMYLSHNYPFPSSRTTTKLPKLDHHQVSSTVCVKKSFEENRLNQSGGASTSGRNRRRRRRDHDEEEEEEEEEAVLLVSSPQIPPPLGLLLLHPQHLLINSSYNYLLHQNLDDEIDALIRLQNETLQSVVEQTQQRQCRLLLSVLEHHVQRRLKEKQIELESAWGRNAELEEKVKQMSSENQMWFNVAKNNEAMVMSLRSTLEHQLLNLHHQNQKKKTTTMGLGLGRGGGQGTKVEHGEEGFGDSSDGVADDAQSANNCHQLLLQQVNVGEREYKTVSSSSSSSSNLGVRDDASMMMMMMMKHRKMCKVCKEKEVCVLLLPCRHLCLCKDCESKLQTCPICNSFKNASLQIFMS